MVMCAAMAASQPPLGLFEQEGVYRVLEAVNPEIPWRSLFPDDLCSSAPHGVVCDEGDDDDNGGVSHVTELNFGYVSDYTPNPPCSPKATIHSSLLAPFTHLRKLFFFQCFTEAPVSFPDLSSLVSLEEAVFVENPALYGPISGDIGRLRSLRRFVLTGTNVSGEMPVGFGGLYNVEQVTLSRNKLSGYVRTNFQALNRLRVLDLSQNQFSGAVPVSIGNLTQLLKLDLSFNQFSGRIPETLRFLNSLEFLDLSYNRFTNSGIPAFIPAMPKLKEIYLSGNNLGGVIPEKWENMGGLQGIGLSRTGLVGNIPVSMGIHLRNVCYLGLDNNYLEGAVPAELGALEFVNELNLENNNLSGKVPFSAEFALKVGEKLKVHGNPLLCVDEGLRSTKVSGSLGNLKLCSRHYLPKSAPLSNSSPVLHSSIVLMIIGILCLFS
nr:piriformospora indica-insensitive protein 2 [Ipomoea batatas]